MKTKAFTIFLAIIVTLTTLSSCTPSGNEKSNETSTIALTTDNVREYLAFNVTYSDFNSSKLSISGLTTYSATAYKTVEAYSTQDISFSDVLIKLKCDTLDVWSEDVAEIRLSSSGTGKVTGLIKYESIVKPSSPQFSGEIIIESVSGTITIK